MSMIKEIKVCVIGPSVDTNYIGGVATHVKNLKSLSCLKNSVIYDVGSAHCNNKANVFQIINNIYRLRRKINKGQYNYVFVNTSIYLTSFIKLLLLLVFFPKREGLQIHVFFHGGRFALLNSFFAKKLNTFIHPLLKKANVFHFLSKVQLDGFCRLFTSSEVRLFANYSTTDEILVSNRNNTESVLNLLFVGRVAREKGIFELVSAVEKISAEKDNIRLTVVGDGPDLPELIFWNQKLPHGIVCFNGFLKGIELENAYKNADILVLPTYHPEGFPYVFIEAMRAGLPVIATNEGALEYLIQDGDNGFKIPAKDVDSLVTAISKIIGDHNQLKQMSGNCYRYFHRHLSKTVAEKYYYSLLTEKAF
ncbi:glycosyltransferase family 4 protein [Desulfoprunum benzoelyticum]|uniref:Glycosyltransferase involved in cell wall biosynthesis n=1 Tax=Desulfoprunum benzoelyticum TaxID=1506996 RepID=A0A840UTJ3_9BACT|nr:glycosyltransferase family 4 protein [Desulfoprunum benzoelyticum]MBB5348073.1 glycosyltransferase involved in cell wall biosynthesis [Desulfoprunum benzoelyticum]MBM9531587.1 glycosyltransferase family 4 protein [Desulfoprunum benzoelyticum]